MSGKPNAVSWFEIPVSDIERAKSFYEAVLEIEIKIMDMLDFRMAWFPVQEMGSPGAPGSLIQGEKHVPSHDGTLVYLFVDDIEATLERIEKHGGKTLNPKMGIGEYGYIAHFEDSEGNRVGLHARQ